MTVMLDCSPEFTEEEELGSLSSPTELYDDTMDSSKISIKIPMSSTSSQSHTLLTGKSISTIHAFWNFQKQNLKHKLKGLCNEICYGLQKIFIMTLLRMR